MKIRKMQNGGYPANVQELLRGLESDLRPSTLASAPRDPDIETNRRRRVDGPYNLPKAYGYEELMKMTPPPPERPIGGDQVFYTPEEQRFREYSRPGGGRDQMKEQMGEVAAGFVPGLGDAQELGYIGRDVAAGDYDAAGLGALLMLLPGAMGKYGVDAYKALRNKIPNMMPESLIRRIAEVNIPNMNPDGSISSRANRQAAARPIDRGSHTTPYADKLRAQDSMLFDENLSPEMQQALIDDMIRNGYLDYGATIQDARRARQKDINMMETMTGSDRDMGYGDIYELAPSDIRDMAGARGGMPFEEMLRRGAFTLDGVDISKRLGDLRKQMDQLEFDAVQGPSASRAQARADFLVLEQERDQIVKDALETFMRDYKASEDKLARVYLKLMDIRNPSQASLDAAKREVRQMQMKINPEELNTPKFLNEKGGKIPYKVIKR